MSSFKLKQSNFIEKYIQLLLYIFELNLSFKLMIHSIKNIKKNKKRYSRSWRHPNGTDVANNTFFMVSGNGKRLPTCRPWTPGLVDPGLYSVWLFYWHRNPILVSFFTRKIFLQKNPLAPQDFYLPFRLASTNCMYTFNASERNSFGGKQVYVRWHEKEVLTRKNADFHRLDFPFFMRLFKRIG